MWYVALIHKSRQAAKCWKLLLVTLIGSSRVFNMDAQRRNAIYTPHDFAPEMSYYYNHKNYNFLACDWFKNVLFSTNSLAKLLSDSLFLDLALINRAGGLYGRILTEVVSTDRTQ